MANIKATKTTTNPAPLAIPASNPAERITADNVQILGERFAQSALRKYHAKSGLPFIWQLYCGLVADITENKKTGAPLSDGYDVAQIASCELWTYAGKTLASPADNGQKDKDGNGVTVRTAVFRAISKYVNGEKQHELKRVYLDEITENGEHVYYIIPQDWDLPTITDYKRIIEHITAMQLSNAEKRVLTYRMRGKSYADIARIIGTTKATIAGYQTRIKAKAKKVPAIMDALNRYHV